METMQHNPHTFYSGIIICLIGFLLCYVVGKRRFKRRGIGGLQHYNSYGAAVVTTLLEKLLKIIGILLIIAGLFTILNNRPQQNEVTKQHKNISTQNNHPKKSI